MGLKCVDTTFNPPKVREGKKKEKRRKSEGGEREERERGKR